MKREIAITASILFVAASVLLAAEDAGEATPVSMTGFGAVVAADGSGSYKTIQAAIAAAPDDSGKPFMILVKPGTYQGSFMVTKEKANIKLVGENPETTILTYNLNVYEAPSSNTYQFNPGLVVVGKNFEAENLTIQNTSGDHGQALSVRCDSDRCSFRNCRITGWQDTLMVNGGRYYFTNCYLAGRVDFIYGSGTVVFDQCEIHSRNGGFITAANTPEDRPYGFVFLNCKLTGDSTPWRPGVGQKVFEKADVKAFLGRPWRPHACVAYINCWMGDHIQPEGWNNWGKVSNEQTARYSEYDSSGPGANPSARVKWATLLTDEQAKVYTVENILGGPDHWNPVAEGSGT